MRPSVVTLTVLLVSLAACTLRPYAALPTTDELNTIPHEADLYAKYPELVDCSGGDHWAADTFSTRSAKSLIEAWGKPDEWSVSAWNLMVWMIPIAPLTVWEWTRFDRKVEITVWHPLVRGYSAGVWICDFGPLHKD